MREKMTEQAGTDAGTRLPAEERGGFPRRIPVPVALLLTAAYTAGRYFLGRSGADPGPWALILIGPVTEEILYRGILCPSLEQAMPPRAAAACSAALFAAGHRGFPAMLGSLAFGYGAARLTRKTGKLRWAIFLHIGWNLAVYLLR